MRHSQLMLALSALAVALWGCGGDGSMRGSGAGGAGVGGSSVGGSGVGGNAGSGGSAGVPLPQGTNPEALIPARIRRLTTAEYDKTLRMLLGTSLEPARDFAPDARQDGYTVNDAQRVDAVLIRQLYNAAERVAEEARPRLAELAPCDGAAAEECAATFIQSFGPSVYRRPLQEAEVQDLLWVYGAGATEATYEEGILHVLRALLQSAGLLYLTELGAGSAAAGQTFSLTPYELASALSYLITAGPPDQALLDAALAGQLNTPEGRRAEAQRLVENGGVARDRFVRVVREWLQIDRIDQIAKDSNVYPDFGLLKDDIAQESVDFIASVLSGSSGNVSELLGASWTVAEPTLTTRYGGSAEADPRIPGKFALTTRRGILNQAAFLSVHAHAHESAPVLRGVAIARRLGCLDIPSPTTLNIDTTPPIPDPSKTTRERFSAHTADDACVSCHRLIDPLGFAFENFDGMGMERSEDNQQPVDSAVSIALGSDFDGSYADGNELAVALAESPTVQRCFARHMFRAASGRSGTDAQVTEDEYLRVWQEVAPDLKGNVVESLYQFVASPLFSHRRQP